MTSKKKLQKILVTGGNGFVGTNLIQKLSRDPQYEVTCLDITTPKHKLPNVTYLRLATFSPSFVSKTKDQSFTFDIIIHLGEYSRIENSYEHIEEVIAKNVIGTANVLEFWRRTKSKLIYASSSSIKTKGIHAAFSNPYSYYKDVNTTAVKNYSEWFGLDHSTVYFYNVYGEGENHTDKMGTVIAKFIKMKQEGHTSLPVTYPGTQKRNFTHIEDITDGILLVIKKGISGQEYEIGAKESHSVTDVCKFLRLPHHIVEGKRGNRLSSQVNTTKITSLGWKQKHTLKEYLSTK